MCVWSPEAQEHSGARQTATDRCEDDKFVTKKKNLWLKKKFATKNFILD